MKNLYYLVPLVFLGLFLLPAHKAEHEISTYHAKFWNTSGPAGGFTGAPGENNCTSCHAGAVQDGNNGENLLTFNDGQNEVTLGVARMMTLNFTSGAVKNGFQLVALDENDDMAGAFIITDPTNTQLRSQGLLGRQYVTHTSGGTSQSQWSFEWEAPNSAEEVTFYVATNRTNNGNNSSGDVIYLSSHTFSVEAGDPSANITEDWKNLLSFGYIVNQHQLIIDGDLPNQAELHLNIYDLKGKAIVVQSLGQSPEGNYQKAIDLPYNMENGIYVATLFLNNKPLTHKFMVQR
jgi:hypothetical protein